MKFRTVVWDQKTKTEIVKGQNTIIPSPILPPIFPNVHQSWCNFNGSVQTVQYRRLLTDCRG